MIRFYAPDIATNPVLSPEDSAHMVRVLRMRQGDVVNVVDGQGHVYTCTLAAADARHALLHVESVADEPRTWPFTLTVMVAPTKHIDRMEWLVEKLTEVGVDRFVPVLCARSERREIKEERLRRIAISAMKQSLKAQLPEILPMTSIKEAVTRYAATQNFMGYCDSAYPRLTMAQECRPATDTAILIGPEGDFTADEVQLAVNAGFVPVTMGPQRLRTETAALAAALTPHIITQSKA